jgi:hypothetical protein
MMDRRAHGVRTIVIRAETGSAGPPRRLRKTCGLLWIRIEKPQVPAKIRRGPALQICGQVHKLESNKYNLGYDQIGETLVPALRDGVKGQAKSLRSTRRE